MPFIYTDLPFFLAVAAFGWGLSLATYRMFAERYQWPMGAWHRNRPALPVLLGLVAFVCAALFAWARGLSNVPGAAWAGLSIVLFGLVLAIVWTGFLRVASQLSLFLAPVAAILLLLGWAHVTFPGGRELVPARTYYDTRPGSGPVIIDEKGRVETLPRVQPRAQ